MYLAPYRDRLLVTGDRDWDDGTAVARVLRILKPRLVIHGGARGADLIAAANAELQGIEVLPFPADWRRYGRAAGPIRNRLMIRDGAPTACVWFHHDLDASKGTKDMVGVAQCHVPTRSWLEILEAA